MRSTVLILSGLSGLLAIFTTICGVWIKVNGAKPSDLAFHGGIAAATTVAAVVSAILIFVYLKK